MDDQVEKELLEWDAAMATEDSEGGISNNADEDESESRLTSRQLEDLARRQLEEWDTAFGAPKGDKSNP